MLSGAMVGSGSQLVVIGASAGGIEALSRVVAGLPAGIAAPIVIAQHLDPRRPSHLAEILGRHAALPIRIVDDGMPLEDGVIFVIPSNHRVEVTGAGLRLLPAEHGAIAPSVDLLLSSGAKAFGEGLIAVILTGTGSDGSAGAWDVKQAGGTVVIENPATAMFPSMPGSVSPSLVDATADLDAIAEVLVGVLGAGDGSTAGREGGAVAVLLDRLRERSGIDFGAYKSATVLRRLHGRMSATRQATVEEYAGLVERDPTEYARLVDSLLIKVTEFFRDPKVWDHLRERILPELIEVARREGRELRVWSAGCSTGEEAYTLAMTIAEAFREDARPIETRIFATDIDAAAIAFARRGVYSTGALTKVPPLLRDRYFTPSAAGFEVRKRVRSQMIFGEHDLSMRVPFPRIDLLLCRNVLIYFTPALQRLALETFAYSMRSDGRLVLGPSETVGALPRPYADDNARLRIYRRRPGPQVVPHAWPKVTPAPRDRGPAVSRVIEPSRREPLGEALASAEAVLRGLDVGIIVVDAHYDVVRINTAARRVLGIHGTAFDQDFVHLAEVLPSTAVRNAIDGALKGKTSRAVYEVESVHVATDSTRHIEATVRPYGRDSGAIEGAVIELSDVTRGEVDRAGHARTRERLAKAATLNDRLLRANDELTAVIAELRLTNKDLLRTSEDAQASREEVETLNEELQATNEELETLNEELTASVEELRIANEDLAARTDELRLQAITITQQKREADEEHDRLGSILASIGDAVVAVDHAGRTVATNVVYDRLFGDPMGEIQPEDVAGLPFRPEDRPEQRAARGERFRVEFAVSDAVGNRRWFEAVAEPLTAEDRTWGGVVSIRDVTERTMRVSLERLMAAAGHELKTPTAAIHNYLQLVERRLASGDADEAGMYAARAVVQGRRLSELVERLFDVSRIKTGQLEIVVTSIDLVTVVREATELASVLPNAPAIAFSAKPASLMVLGDRGRLEQVFLNLLANAIEHASGSGSIEVSVRRSGRFAVADVRDHGPGIAADDLSGLFEAYGRLGYQERPTGLGLGLFVSREIVAAHGGSIKATSVLGDGTTFSVRLPTGPEAKANRRSRPPGAVTS
ncbi:MAG: two-component system, chemotaxis family, CheB/CheR fusion protein [Chloroflexota bacterium]|nr:two-component system, chemotaxis family, CheB/CheR fusion protein [Chloroflexota bacterium]